MILLKGRVQSTPKLLDGYELPPSTEKPDIFYPQLLISDELPLPHSLPSSIWSGFILHVSLVSNIFLN